MIQEDKNSILNSEDQQEESNDFSPRFEDKFIKSPRRASRRTDQDEDSSNFNIFNSRPVKNKDDIDDTSEMIDLGESQSNIMKRLRQHQYKRYKLDENDDKK